MRDERVPVRPAQDKPLHGAPFPPGRLHPALYVAEFIGTGLLVLFGVSVVILMFGQGSPGSRLIPTEGLRLFLTGGLFGSVGALIAVSPIGRISGAHINPAVTLAFWLEGKLAWRDTALYILAQLAGSVVGAMPLLAWGSMGQSVAFGATQPGPEVPAWAAMLGEAGVTFLLVLAILTTAAHPRTQRFTPLVMPAVLSILVWLEAPISGASANPARSFGPALVANIPIDPWIYMVGPSLGAVLYAGLVRLEAVHLPRVTVARLFHFHLEV
ncbi:MIP/aquaporin family protein [Microvirga sp. VF16]|uniref:MIP/aquaporin family protein n=1 Tax=Microvirga sp. VF16 TaxID=2807101 RepID=UPI00193CF702|nr:MIP/aquaporin family protein [Microvirga sp. VF16]QRM30364.1 aquaporin family protein [Microvirga sp. VF16]